jgi:alcohol dehydrogenase class IV
MLQFVYDQPAGRVVFGVGAIERLAGEVFSLHVHRPLIVSTPGRRAEADATARQLGDGALVHAEAVMHVPADIARRAVETAARHAADGVVAVGGGSTIGLAKWIARETGLPIVAVPTTYAGSEMTAIWGVTEAGRKQTGRDRRVLPKTVIYDPALTVDLPARVSGPSGMNALAHAVEALYAEDANPVATLQAVEGIRALGRSLPVIVREPANLEARADALYGAWLAAATLATTTVGLHHKACHVLGGMFNVSHADTHSVMLPYAVRFQQSAAADSLRLGAAALGGRDAASAIRALAVRIGAPTALKDIGVPHDGIDRAAETIASQTFYSPAAVGYAAARRLLEDAYAGTGFDS